MDIPAIAILLLMCFGASFVQRVTGFGFGIFIMTVLPYLMPSYGEATALSGMLALVTSLLVTIKMWRYVSWRKLMPILITFVIVSFIAIEIVASIDNTTLRRILGVTLILVSIYFIFLKERITVNPTIGIQVGMGTLSGVMGGLFAMQGPPAVLYFLAATKSKEEYMAIAQIYFLAGNIMMTGFRAANSFVTTDVLKCWIFALPMVWIGNWVGTKVFELISARTLSYIIYIFIGISGIVALSV